MELLVLGFLILLNGLFSLSEIALVSCKRNRIEQVAAKGNRSAKRVLSLLNSPDNFLSAIQVGITLIGILTGVYGGISLADDFTPYLQQIEPIREFAPQISLVVIVILITYISIVIGELVPKTIALSNPESIALKVSPFIFYFSKLFFPIVIFLSFSTSLINKMLGIKKQSEYVTEEELRQLLKTASRDGVIRKEQKAIHDKLFYFADKKAKHLMTHRTDVEWINVADDAETLKKNILASQHSYLLVCQENIDNFIGVLPVKEFLKNTDLSKEDLLTALVVSPSVVFENADAQKILNSFKEKRRYFAVVINEYGGLEGIITLHDIVEGIIGAIPDEQDNEPEVFVREDKSVLISGDAPVEILHDIVDNLDFDFETMDYATVAGFILSNLNKVPEIGDKFTFENFTFEVVDIDGNKIDKILVYKTNT
ncbi:MAG TPA: hemolysin family protein [Prolixibacteraceae bacterium]|nr:hemolysin family protein [Prolixibacteraceae bacterium]